MRTQNGSSFDQNRNIIIIMVFGPSNPIPLMFCWYCQSPSTATDYGEHLNKHHRIHHVAVRTITNQDRQVRKGAFEK